MVTCTDHGKTDKTSEVTDQQSQCVK